MKKKTFRKAFRKTFRKTSRKVFRHRTILGFIFTLVIAVMLSTIYVISTEQGLRLAFRISQATLPGKLEAKSISGTLFRGINIHKLHYQNPQMDLSIDNIILH